MSTSKLSTAEKALLCVGLVFLVTGAEPFHARAMQANQNTPEQGYISGTVESNNGPERGVWVIAETNDLPTKFVKIVVTNDDGRFVLPELPDATYDVWVRGYGLIDSAKIKVKPGKIALALKATVANTAQEAAAVYPGNYWYSLIEPPSTDEFPGTGEEGNGISSSMKTRAQWIDRMKQGCQLCHQMGTKITRTLSHLDSLNFKSSIEAWDHRVQQGVRGTQMYGRLNTFGRPRALEMFSDWTDRIAAGEVPVAPPRPKGIERNVVLTLWDWGVETSFIHDEIATDKNNPHLNAYGPVYGASAGHGKVSVVDPIKNRAYEMTIPTREDPKTIPSRFPRPLVASTFYGSTHHWSNPPENPADPHNPMIDSKGRLWLTSTIRSRPNPEWCGDGSENKFAQYFPLDRGIRQASFYDTDTKEWTLIDTCFGTHHLQFAGDENETLYFSGGGAVIGWINTKKFDETGDEKASQGWSPTVLDTNGDGVITRPWNEPVGAGRSQDDGGGGGQNISFDPNLDTRVRAGSYGVVVSPVDHALWAASTDFPGYIFRFMPGENPPQTSITERFQVPTPDLGFGPRGIDVDRDGVIWTALSGSSHLASFDRRKCEVLKGPETLNGKHCPEGWALYQVPGPNLKGTDVRADFHYYNWVDQFNTLGLGDNIPIATGSGSDSMQALVPQTGQWVTLRVPYPLGFFSRGVDGRIDDAAAGWKGRGLWANYGTNYPWHTEGGKGTKSKIVHFQLRPDPLAH